MNGQEDCMLDDQPDPRKEPRVDEIAGLKAAIRALKGLKPRYFRGNAEDWGADAQVRDKARRAGWDMAVEALEGRLTALGGR